MISSAQQVRLSKQDVFTSTGRWAFVVALLFVFSTNAGYRLSVAGLLVHPYLILLPVAWLLGGVRINSLPKTIRDSLFVFFFIFSLACVQNLNPLSEVFKVGASLATFVFFVVSIRSEKDFRFVAWGLLLCALVIGVQGLWKGEEVTAGARLSGVNVLEGLGNKNAQSLYTLPGIFVGILLLLKYLKERKLFLSMVLSVSLFLILVSVFLSANRSGWLGLLIILIVYVIYLGLGIRSILLLSVFGVLVYFVIERYAFDIVDHKREQTIEGYSSDLGRQRLALLAFEVGLENPILGVGMDELHREMAYRLKLNKFGVEKTDTHILWGYLFGATGIFSLIAFIFFLFSITKNRYLTRDHVRNSLVRKVRWLLIGFVILFCVRALFSREILYSPTFMCGLGLMLGYYLVTIQSANDSAGPR